MTEPQMVYITTGLTITPEGHVVPAKPAKQEGGARKYAGETAANYDKKREESPKWHWEKGAIEALLDKFKKGDWVLDVPVGTGRFIPYYAEKGFLVRGVDISQDMLKIAAQKIPEDLHCDLFVGTVLQMDGIWDKSSDVSVMCRLTRWLSPDECKQAMKELQRVTRQRILITARTEHQRAELARPVELFVSALEDGWELNSTCSMPGDDAYKILCFDRQKEPW